MNCPRCKVEMKTGIAIVPYGEDVRGIVFFQLNTKNAHEHLYEVLKCPKCGHSEKFTMKG